MSPTMRVPSIIVEDTQIAFAIPVEVKDMPPALDIPIVNVNTNTFFLTRYTLYHHQPMFNTS